MDTQSNILALPLVCQEIKVPLRFIPFHAENCLPFETKILNWLNAHRNDDAIACSKDLCYIIEIGQLPSNMEIKSSLMKSFLTEVLVPLVTSCNHIPSEQSLSEITTISYVYEEMLKGDISFLIYINPVESNLFDFDPWFDDHHFVICPCLFGNYIFYPALNPNGIKLKHIYQFATTNIYLDQIGMDWRSFNKNMVTRDPSYFKVANQELGTILTGTSKALSLINKENMEEVTKDNPTDEMFWKKNIYQCHSSAVSAPTNSLSRCEQSLMETLSDSLSNTKQNKRVHEEKQKPKKRHRGD